jgi:hypothetical protein
MRSASRLRVMRVAWATASLSPSPSRWLRRAQDGLELVDRLGASLDRGILGEFEHPGAVHRTVAGLRAGPGTATEHGPRSSQRIERVRLPEQSAGRAVGPVHFVHLDVLSQQTAGQARSEGAGPLHTGTAHHPQLAGPDEQPTVAGRRGRKGLGAQDLPQRGDHGGNMDLAVRVHAQDDLAQHGRSVLVEQVLRRLVVMVARLPRGGVLGGWHRPARAV